MSLYTMRARRLPFLILLALFSSGTALSAEMSASEAFYVWQAGDTLSSALFKNGVGHNKAGPRLYGRRGFIARNLERYPERQWEEIVPGTKVLLLLPRGNPLPKSSGIEETKHLVPSSGQDEALQFSAKTRTAQHEPTVENIDPLKTKVSVLKPAQAPEVSAPETESDSRLWIASGLLVLCILLAVLVRRSQKNSLNQQKLEIIARSFLSWLVLDCEHSPEHINLAETLFLGSPDEKALISYELMGYFHKDLQYLDRLDKQRQITSGLPTGGLHPESLQAEYFAKYMSSSGVVLQRILFNSRSRYFAGEIARLQISPRSADSRAPDRDLKIAS